MKSALEIYRKSLALIGETESEDSLTLRERAVPVINVLLAQLYEMDLALKGEAMSASDSVPQIERLEDHLALADPILFTLMPLGLAGYLLCEEEPARAGFFLQLYQTERDVLAGRCRRGRRHKIRREV